MRTIDLIHTQTEKLIKEEKVLVLDSGERFLDINQTLKLMNFCNRSIEIKDLDFRRDSFDIGDKKVNPEIPFLKQKGSKNKLVAKLQDIQSYILSLYNLSVEVDYYDAKTVVGNYDSVLERSRKHGMRGQRNFTGKIEDEIRGKLVELGFAKYASLKSQLLLPVDYALIDSKERKRDYGDFTKYVKDNKFYDIKKGFTISTKSTNGNFLAIPKVELDWEGDLFVLLKLHIKETFLYKAIKAGLKIGSIDFNEVLGWVEIRGFVSKAVLLESYLGLNFPGSYKLDTNFRQENYIMAPSQLNRNTCDLVEIFDTIKQ